MIPRPDSRDVVRVGACACAQQTRPRERRRSNRGINESTWYHVDASIVNEPLIVRCRAQRTTVQKSCPLDHAKGVNALTSCSWYRWWKGFRSKGKGFLGIGRVWFSSSVIWNYVNEISHRSDNFGRSLDSRVDGTLCKSIVILRFSLTLTNNSFFWTILFLF